MCIIIEYGTPLTTAPHCGACWAFRVVRLANKHIFFYMLIWMVLENITNHIFAWITWAGNIFLNIISIASTWNNGNSVYIVNFESSLCLSAYLSPISPLLSPLSTLLSLPLCFSLSLSLSLSLSQITSVSSVCSTVYSGADQRKHQSSTSLAFVRGIRRWPVNSPHKGPVSLQFQRYRLSEIIMCVYIYVAGPTYARIDDGSRGILNRMWPIPAGNIGVIPVTGAEGHANGECKYIQKSNRVHSRLAPSQWETALQSNAVSHWLSASLESALYPIVRQIRGLFAEPCNAVLRFCFFFIVQHRAISLEFTFFLPVLISHFELLT